MHKICTLTWSWILGSLPEDDEVEGSRMTRWRAPSIHAHTNWFGYPPSTHFPPRFRILCLTCLRNSASTQSRAWFQLACPAALCLQGGSGARSMTGPSSMARQCPTRRHLERGQWVGERASQAIIASRCRPGPGNSAGRFSGTGADADSDMGLDMVWGFDLLRDMTVLSRVKAENAR